MLYLILFFCFYQIQDLIDSICDTSYAAIDKFLDNLDVCISLCLNTSVELLPKSPEKVITFIKEKKSPDEVCFYYFKFTQSNKKKNRKNY